MSDQRKATIVSFMNLVGGLSGIIAICALVWGGGRMAARLDAAEFRLLTIERDGSATAREHVKQGSVIDGAQDARLATLETYSRTLPERIATISTKLDILIDQLNRKQKDP